MTFDSDTRTFTFDVSSIESAGEHTVSILVTNATSGTSFKYSMAVSVTGLKVEETPVVIVVVEEEVKEEEEEPVLEEEIIPIPEGEEFQFFKASI